MVDAGQRVTRHASIRSVWLLNSIRGALALAAAIAIADLTGLEHGFWVVLGTLSVLRTSASATGSTAWRALAGTVIGFAIGAPLITVVGANQTALWVILPVAVLVAAYTPGTAPVAFGQAAFTVVVIVLFNLLLPEGWRIGVVRIEDVAIGCSVSLVAGVLFWPHGASRVVADDLADAFRAGGSYLAAAARWALGWREEPPTPGAAVAASVRLDGALRGYLSEQGSKRTPKEDLWRLAVATDRLRLTASSLAGLPALRMQDATSTRRRLQRQADDVAAWFDQLAASLTSDQPPTDPPDLLVADRRRAADSTVAVSPGALWVGQHIEHLTPHLEELVGPAMSVSAQRSRPWWR